MPMNEREMFEKSFQRPTDYFKLSERHQYQIDSNLGILDWEGKDLSQADLARFKAHYSGKKTTENSVKKTP